LAREVSIGGDNPFRRKGRVAVFFSLTPCRSPFRVPFQPMRPENARICAFQAGIGRKLERRHNAGLHGPWP